MNCNIQGDFQIYISVPLNFNYSSSKQEHSQRSGRWEVFPALFLILKEIALILRRKFSDFLHLWVKISFKMLFLGMSRRKNPNIFLMGDFSFICCRRNVYRSVLIPKNLPCPEKFLAASLINYSKITYLIFIQICHL